MHNVNADLVVKRGMSRKTNELSERIAIIVFLIPFAAWAFVDDGWINALAFAIALALAGAEFACMFRRQGLRPSLPVVVAGIFMIAVGRHTWDGRHAGLIFAITCLAAQIWHLVDYERGAVHSATDFAITVAGLLLLGWIGSYLVLLRRLPDGLWWMLIALPSAWVGDAFAYIGGKALGRHTFSHRISPKKTWEGYVIGACMGTLSGIALAMLWRIGAGAESEITLVHGLVLAGGVNFLAPIGDLGISMIKREFQVKDASSLLPGHGGILDRLDSWLWSGVLAFYLVNWFTI
jgi:phosphatidate cytidylyltransferase